MMPLLTEGPLIIALAFVALLGASLLTARRAPRHRAAAGGAIALTREVDLTPGDQRAQAGEAARPSPEGAAAGPQPAAAPRSEGALAILVAEDNPVNRAMALRQLQRLGYTADAVTNGREAVAAASSRPYDLILMDMRMPELDGDQATRALRSLGDAIRQPYIIALTANAMEGDRERCLSSGMNDYLSKPVLLTDLRDAIGRAAPLSDWTPPPPAPPAPSAGGAALDAADLLDEALIAEAIVALSDDRVEAADLLIGLYQAEIPPQIEALVRAVGERDRDGLRSVAHKLMGGCWQIGARGLAARCAALERDAPAEPYGELVRHVAGIRSCNEATLRLLKARCGRLPG